MEAGRSLLPRCLLLVLGSWIGSSRADGGEAPPASNPMRRVVDAVVAAVAAGDPAALRALAAQDVLDPLTIVDEMLAAGRRQEAAVFAAAAPRYDLERLPEYVAAASGRPDDAEGRTALDRGNALLDAKRWEPALEAYGDAPRTDSVVASRIQRGRGIALRELRRFPESAAAFRRAAEIASRIGWVSRAALTYGESGGASYLGSDYAAARDGWEAQLAIDERRGDRMGIGSCLTDIALSCRRLGAWQRALDLLHRAVAIDLELGDEQGLAMDLANLGSLYLDLGQPEEAARHYRRALVIDERRGDLEGVAGDLMGLGSVHRDHGNPAEGLRYHERALAVAREIGDRKMEAMVLQNLAHGYRDLGATARALELQREAVRTLEGLGHRGTLAAAYDGLGTILRASGRPAEALEAHEQARAIDAAIGDRRGMLHALVNLGVAHTDLRDDAKAGPIFEGALALAEDLGDRKGVAAVALNLASVARRAGDVPSSLAWCDRSLRAARETGFRDVEVRALWKSATALSLGGRWREAVDAATEAVGLVPSLVRGVAEEHAGGAREGYAGLYATGARAAAVLGDAEAVAFFLESGRAGALLESAAVRRAVVASSVPAPLLAAENAARVRETEAAGALRRLAGSGSPEDLAAAEEALRTARAAVADAVGRIQREQKAAASVAYPRPDPLSAMAERLEPGEALVLYGMHEDASVALVVRRERTRIVPLAGSGAIATACARLRPEEAALDPTEAIRSLRDLLVEPLDLPAEVTRLLVSPHGPLADVPFCLLEPDREVVYVPSGTAYGLLREEASVRGEGVLALGDPDYGQPRPADLVALVGPERTGGALVGLPATADEAKAVGTTVLLRGEATETAFREALRTRPRWRAVHFACHGVLDADQPLFSSLALTPAGTDDGFLTALDVFSLRIPADLAVLSACETGKGKTYRAEGCVGLTRAFLFAGPPRVLVSLWKVDDAATLALMRRFYAAWGEGVPVARALREAQQAIARDPRWAHPRFWAAWALWGLPQ